MDHLTESLSTGLQAELTLMVAPEHLASRWGSGGVEVLATPHMIGLMEQAAVRAVDRLLPAGYCTVGTHIDVRHLAATPIGHHVVARAELQEIHGRRLVFKVTAEDQAGPIGEGLHERTIVLLDRFIHHTASRVGSANSAPSDQAS